MQGLITSLADLNLEETLDETYKLDFGVLCFMTLLELSPISLCFRFILNEFSIKGRQDWSPVNSSVIPPPPQ